MKSYIFIGGEVEKSALESPIPENALVIAADSGYDNAKILGYAERCDFVVGDFDSTKERAFCSRAKIVRVPVEKDETDTQLAINIALEQGTNEIYIIGGLSGRLDHTLSNLHLLENLTKSGISCAICDGKNRVRYLKERSSLLIPKGKYKYFGLILITEKAKGITVDGAKYPLKNANLEKTNPSYAISNEVEGNFAMVSLKKGGLLVIESRE